MRFGFSTAIEFHGDAHLPIFRKFAPLWAIVDVAGSVRPTFDVFALLLRVGMKHAVVHDCIISAWVCVQFESTAWLDAGGKVMRVNSTIFTGLDEATGVWLNNDAGWVIDTMSLFFAPNHILAAGLEVTTGIVIALNILAHIGLVSNRREASRQGIGARIRGVEDVATIADTGEEILRPNSSRCAVLDEASSKVVTLDELVDIVAIAVGMVVSIGGYIGTRIATAPVAIVYAGQNFLIPNGTGPAWHLVAQPFTGVFSPALDVLCRVGMSKVRSFCCCRARIG